jgi:hypothetical protein
MARRGGRWARTAEPGHSAHRVMTSHKARPVRSPHWVCEVAMGPWVTEPGSPYQQR